MKLILDTGEKLTPEEALAKAEQASLFGAPKKPKPVQGELLRPEQRRTRSTQYYLGPRGGKWADPEHTIPWSGEGGALEGQVTIQAPGVQDVSQIQHESPVVKDIIERQSKAVNNYVKVAVAARDKGDHKTAAGSWAQAERACRNVAAALEHLGKVGEAKGWLKDADKLSFRKDEAFQAAKEEAEGPREGYFARREREEEARRKTRERSLAAKEARKSFDYITGTGTIQSLPGVVDSDPLPGVIPDAARQTREFWKANPRTGIEELARIAKGGTAIGGVTPSGKYRKTGPRQYILITPEKQRGKPGQAKQLAARAGREASQEIAARETVGEKREEEFARVETIAGIRVMFKTVPGAKATTVYMGGKKWRQFQGRTSADSCKAAREAARTHLEAKTNGGPPMKKGVAEKIPGGLAEGKKPGDFDQAQLKMGVEVELEHTKDRAKAKEIAMDHLVEDPKYYTHLREMEAKHAKKSLEKGRKGETPIGGITPGGYRRVAKDKYEPARGIKQLGREEAEAKTKYESQFKDLAAQPIGATVTIGDKTYTKESVDLWVGPSKTSRFTHAQIRDFQENAAKGKKEKRTRVKPTMQEVGSYQGKPTYKVQVGAYVVAPETDAETAKELLGQLQAAAKAGQGKDAAWHKQRLTELTQAAKKDPGSLNVKKFMDELVGHKYLYDAKRKEQPMEKAEITQAKAKKILRDGEVHGHPLTDQQKKFFGAIAGGEEPQQKAMRAPQSPEEEERREAEKEKRDPGKPPSLPAMKKGEQPANLDAWLAKAGGDEEIDMEKGKDTTPGESLVETSTEELTQTLKDIVARLKADPKDAAALQKRREAIAAELKKRKAPDFGGEAEKAVTCPGGKIRSGGKGRGMGVGGGQGPIGRMGKSESGIEALDSFAKGGPYIGPRQGKWADPQHTIPWDPTVHGKGAKKPEAKAKTPIGGKPITAGDLKPGDVIVHKNGAQAKVADIDVIDYGPGKPEGLKVTFERVDTGQKTVERYKPGSKMQDWKRVEKPGGEKAKSPRGAGHDPGLSVDELVKKPMKWLRKRQDIVQKMQAANYTKTEASPGGLKNPPASLVRESENLTVEDNRLAEAVDKKAFGKETKKSQKDTDMEKALPGKLTEPGERKEKVLAEGAAKTPPKEYREGGATGKKDYADPANYKYPIDTEEHVRAAISYFSKPKNAGVYSVPEQKAIWGRIKRAAKKHGIELSDESGPPSVQKSEVSDMDGIDKLASYAEADADYRQELEKAQTMPEGNPKQKLGQGEEQGGKVDGVGKTSGDNTSGGGPGQDAKGQVTGTSTAKDKLSDDEEEDEGQMKEHKKPIETLKSYRPLSIPQAQREQTAHEAAQVASKLRKGEDDVTVDSAKFPTREPEPELEKGREGVMGMVHYSEQSDLEVDRLQKSDDFYSGGSPRVVPFSRPIGADHNCPKCGTAISKSLTACPACGLGAVVHRVVPGGEAQGDHDGEPIVKSRAGGLRPRRVEDVKFK